MHVTLSIKDDSELRAYIKDMIQGQVKNIIREDINQVLHGLSQGSVISTMATLERDVHQEMTQAVKNAVNQAMGGFNMKRAIQDMVKDVIVEEVRRTLGK